MPNSTTESRSTNSDGTVTRTIEQDGTRTTTTVANPAANRRAVRHNWSAYRTNKVFNAATGAYVTVTMTGNVAQDEQLMAAAFNTAGVTDVASVVSST